MFGSLCPLQSGTCWPYQSIRGLSAPLRYFHCLQGLNLVFVAAYQHMLNVPFVDALLALLKDDFVSIYRPNVYQYKAFDERYKFLLEKVRKQAMVSKNKVNNRGGGKTNQSQVCCTSLRYENAMQTVRAPKYVITPSLQQRSINEALTQSDSEDSDDTENRGLGNPNIVAQSFDKPGSSTSSTAQAFNTDVLARRVKSKATKAKPAKAASQAAKPKGKKVCSNKHKVVDILLAQLLFG